MGVHLMLMVFEASGGNMRECEKVGLNLSFTF